MSDRELAQVKEICEKTIDEKVTYIKTIVKWCSIVASSVFALTVCGWIFTDVKEVYRHIHNTAFPVEIPKFSIQPDTVLITAYSKDFVLKQGDPTQDESGFITFYAEPGQKVEYIINVRHRFFSDDAKRRKFFVEVDDRSIYDGSIVEHAGGLRIAKLRYESSPDREKGLHKFGFRLDRSQVDFDPDDEIFVTCIILVSGKQYSI